MASTSDLAAQKLFSVRGYVAVVTGGGTGIGLMAAQALAANGAKVYIVGRREEALENAKQAHNPETGGEIIPFGPCNVRDKAELQKLVEDLSKKEDRVDLLVTAAGISGPRGAPDVPDGQELKDKLWNSESVEAWNDVYDADVTSVYFTTVAFIPLLQEASRKRGDMAGSVVTISSISGLIRHAQGHFAYNAAKGGTVQLTKLMSAEFQKALFRVNSIAPGYFPSEMTMKESGSDQKSVMPNERVQKKGHVPQERPGMDEEMAQAVLFLCKNRYVNGEVIAVDGGVLNVLGS